MRHSGRVFLKDPMQEEAIRKQGYFMYQLLDESDLEFCRNLFHQVNPKLDKVFYSTIDSPDTSYRRVVDEALRERLEERLKNLFVDYYPLVFNFIVKTPSDQNKVGLHVDDTHVEEDQYSTFNVWCPLVDTYPENGGLYVWPGSHLLPYPPRGFGLPYPYLDLAEMIEPQMIPVYQKAGQAVIYSNRLMHLSYPNRTGSVRPAIITGMLPAEAEPIIYFKTNSQPEGKTGVYRLSKEFYLGIDRSKDPDPGLFLREEKFEWKAVSKEEFIQRAQSLGIWKQEAGETERSLFQRIVQWFQ